MSFSALSLLLLTLIVCSCTKNNDSTVIKNPNSIVGLWIGTYTVNYNPAAGNLYYNFDIRSDSSIIVQALGDDGNTYYSEGSWSLSGTSFTGVVTSITTGNKGVVQTLSAAYNNTAGILTGTWRYQDPADSAFVGTFTLNRVN